MDKDNVVDIRCKKCNKLMMEYYLCGDDSAVALQNNSLAFSVPFSFNPAKLSSGLFPINSL